MSAASPTAPPSAPSALSAPSPLPHRRHPLRDDRPCDDPRGTARATAAPTGPYSSICATAVPRNRSTSRYTSRAHTDSRRRPSSERASSYRVASAVSFRYRLGQTIPNPFSQSRVLTAHRQQKHPDRLAEQPQPRQHRDVAHDVRRVNALLACTKTQSVKGGVIMDRRGGSRALEEWRLQNWTTRRLL